MGGRVWCASEDVRKLLQSAAFASCDQLLKTETGYESAQDFYVAKDLRPLRTVLVRERQAGGSAAVCRFCQCAGQVGGAFSARPPARRSRQHQLPQRGSELRVG